MGLCSATQPERLLLRPCGLSGSVTTRSPARILGPESDGIRLMALDISTVISNGCGESTVGASVAVEFAAFEFATRSLIRPAITHTHFEFEIAQIDGSEKFHGARRGGLVSQ